VDVKTIKMKLGAAALVLGASALACAKSRYSRPNPLDFSKPSAPPDPKTPHEGFFKMLFHKMSGGGDFHGWGHLDGMTKTPVNPLHTATVRWKLTF
jgi:hypothetical protein